MDVFVDLTGADGREVVKRKLHNLGYSLGATLEENVRAFQIDCGLASTGKLEDAQDEINRRHDETIPRGAA
jgi:hypothetical protein